MPLQHYLPASYLARFSPENNLESRERLLAVGDKTGGRLFSAPASRVCGINNFYTLYDNPDYPDLVDSSWSFYEKGLGSAIDQLINGT